MKINLQLLIFMALVGMPVHAADKGLNGGDMCEDRFKAVSDDIASWLKAGGSEGLTFPKGLTLSQYDSGLLNEIGKAVVSCVDQELTVGGAEKTCENFVDSKGTPQIVCNDKRFMATSASNQYVLVHHEYAGLAGFEENDGPSSHYPLSNQITGYLADEVVKKLVVKPSGSAADPAIFGEWESEGQKLPAQFSNDVWTITMRVSIQPGKFAESATCQVDGSVGKGTATVAVPAEVDAGKITFQYDAENTVGYLTWGAFGASQSCNASLKGGTFYQLNGNDLTMNGMTMHRVNSTSLSSYPLSQPEMEVPQFIPN